jgi:hypothetical protein
MDLIDSGSEKLRFELMVNWVWQCKIHDYENEKELWSSYNIIKEFCQGENWKSAIQTMDFRPCYQIYTYKRPGFQVSLPTLWLDLSSA